MLKGQAAFVLAGTRGVAQISCGDADLFREKKRCVERTFEKFYAVGLVQVFNAQIQLQAVSENVLSVRILANVLLTAR